MASHLELCPEDSQWLGPGGVQWYGRGAHHSLKPHKHLVDIRGPQPVLQLSKVEIAVKKIAVKFCFCLKSFQGVLR